MADKNKMQNPLRGKICPLLSIADATADSIDWSRCVKDDCQFWQQRNYYTDEGSLVHITGCGMAFPTPPLDSNGRILA